MHPLSRKAVIAENALHDVQSEMRQEAPRMIKYLTEGPPQLTKRQVARKMMRSPDFIEQILSNWVPSLHWTVFLRLESLYYEEKAKHEQTSGDSAPRRDAQTDSEVSD